MLRKIKGAFWLLVSHTIYKQQLMAIGIKTKIVNPLQLDEIGSVALGHRVYIQDGAWIIGNKSKRLTLQIDDNTHIGHFSHIVAKNWIHIERNVLIADKVFISDCSHIYQKTNIPIQDQGIEVFDTMSIGEGSWLGENVCVCGASIGKHCVVGANSVVTTDLPDYCVAVGSPARVVKKYNFDKAMWEKI